MSNEAVAELITSRLNRLPHPDGQPTHLVGYSNPTGGQHQDDIRDRAAKRLGESMVELIETEGYTIVRNDDLLALKNKATEVGVAEPIKVRCICGKELLKFTMSSPHVVTLHGSVVITALSQLPPECPHE